MEIIITAGIVILAAFIIYKNVKKSSSGQCNCGSCNKNCPSRKLNIKK
ncbi:ferrous iron transport protein B [Clostridium moniliforme]|uniref:Ferrous iron transport protein B n=1 Tax=Clostridium moniliforme TaxID=39489 RepID=A0ABS4EYC8_9CLOT|nr:FeoB-associated Cys-rich membrane protein [Clostridium moniliforme]MBP1888857.1 ferrous iron transport protein B [Clostridium moniliforme]